MPSLDDEMAVLDKISKGVHHKPPAHKVIEVTPVTPVIRALPNVKISGIVTSPMKKFQTAYEARGMSGSAAHAVYVCTWSLPKMCVTWSCYRLLAVFLRIYVVWLGGRGSELPSVHVNRYMNIDQVVYMFICSHCNNII